jgi:hypothetical protein
MTQYFARVVSGVVVEIITLPDDVAVAGAFHTDIVSALVAATADITVGQTFAAGVFGPAPAPAAPVPVVPASVTRRQFFQAAATSSLITQAEALALFATGVLPANLATAIAALPAPQQFAAKIAILGAGSFNRTDPLVEALGAAMGQTSAQIDALFTLAATL